MAQATVSAKGSIVIPQDLREKYGIVPSMRVEVLDIGGRVMILPILKNPIAASRGMLKFKGSTLKLLQKFRCSELKKDRQKIA